MVNVAVLTIHLFSRHVRCNLFVVIGYTDSAHGDKGNGRSTGGYVMTMAPHGPFTDGHLTDMRLAGWFNKQSQTSSTQLFECRNAAGMSRRRLGVCSTASLERAQWVHGDEAARD